MLTWWRRRCEKEIGAPFTHQGWFGICPIWWEDNNYFMVEKIPGLGWLIELTAWMQDATAALLDLEPGYALWIKPLEEENGQTNS